MRVIYNPIIPFPGFKAINLFGFVFARKGAIIDQKTLNHEAIHTAQMREVLYVPFYLLYLVEWVVKLLMYGERSYKNISFEREAYQNEHDQEYLKTREKYSVLRHFTVKEAAIMILVWFIILFIVML